VCLRVGLSTCTSRKRRAIKGQAREWVFIGEVGTRVKIARNFLSADELGRVR
jgi:hypothetical protein